MHQAQILRIGVALLCAVVAVGAYGPWGALSTDAVQADIVATTRHMLAGLSLIALVAAAFPKYRMQFAILAAVAFLVAGIIGYGEINYEENQRQAPEGPAWGLAFLFWGSVAGFLVSLTEAALDAARRGRSHVPPGQP